MFCWNLKPQSLKPKSRVLWLAIAHLHVEHKPPKVFEPNVAHHVGRFRVYYLGLRVQSTEYSVRIQKRLQGL